VQISLLEGRQQDFNRPVPVSNVRFGSLADIASRPRHVRFAPETGHQSDIAPCPQIGRAACLTMTNPHADIVQYRNCGHSINRMRAFEQRFLSDVQVFVSKIISGVC